MCSWYPDKPEVAVQCMSNLVVAKNWGRFLALIGDVEQQPGVFVEMAQVVQSLVDIFLEGSVHSAPVSGDSILAIFGEWLFNAADQTQSTAAASATASASATPSSSAAGASSTNSNQHNVSSDSSSVATRNGQALAIGSLCRIFCSPQPQEGPPFQRQHLDVFYKVVIQGLQDDNVETTGSS